MPEFSKILAGILSGVLITAPAFAASPPVDFSVNAWNYLNKANGIPQLDANGNVTASVSNTKVTTQRIEFPTHNQEIVFNTNSPDSNNTQIHIGYDLTNNWVYFSNLHYGNGFNFVGSVIADNINLRNGNLFNAGRFVSDSINPQTTYANQTARLFMDDGMDWGNIHPDTLVMGGFGENQYTHIKATCANTGGGDLGGSCYQFTDMSGPQTGHRSGAGGLDGINIDARSTSNAPVDMIGGNILVTNSDGTHTVTGVSIYPLSAISSGGNTVPMDDSTYTDCGPRNWCSISGVSMVASDGTTSVTEAKATTSVINGHHTLTLAKGVTFAQDIPTTTPVSVKIISSDGIAHAVAFDAVGSVKIYPQTTQNFANLDRGRMTIFTNVANGMNQGEHIVQTGIGASTYDLPNYYYGYWQGTNLTAGTDYSSLTIESTYYPGTSSTKPGFVTINNSSGPAAKPPLQNSGDTLDNALSYTGTDGNTYNNTNKHHYTQPALFIGLNNKNFNSYGLQYYTNPTDGITRSFDNEWDFWMSGEHSGEISSHGLTLTWGGTYLPLTKDSYMVWLAGFNIMPKGIIVGGVFPYGGKLIETDGGFGVFKNVTQGSPSTLGAVQTIATLGQGILGTTYKTDLSASVDIASGDTTITFAGKIDDRYLRNPSGVEIWSHNATTAAAFPTGSSAGVISTNVTYDAVANTTVITLPKAFTASLPAASSSFELSASPSMGVLSEYVSNDGGSNDSLHFGLTSSKNDLEYINDSVCSNFTITCRAESQLIFNPNGVVGGLALGYGQGSNTKLDLIDKQNGNIVVTNYLELGTSLTGNNFSIYAADGGINFLSSPSLSGGYANITSNSLFLHGAVFLDKTGGLVLPTNSADSNNTQVHMYYEDSYDREGAVYFTNFHYGNNFLFNGDVRSTGAFGWDGGTKGVNSNMNMGIAYDTANAAIHIFSDNYNNPGLEYTPVTYANLGTPTVSGLSRFCSDCYSKLREDGDTATGVLVFWNLSTKTWRDVLGLAVLH